MRFVSVYALGVGGSLPTLHFLSLVFQEGMEQQVPEQTCRVHVCVCGTVNMLH